MPERPPAFAVRLGLAEFVPEMTVKVTAKHADGLGDDRRLLIVPKAGRRRPLKLMERLPEWFATFGVSIDLGAAQVPEPLRAEIQDWFGDPTRPMFALPMSGGEPNAAWRLAVACYVALYWETQARGLDSIHFVASIDGRPCFRKNWTSNRSRRRASPARARVGEWALAKAGERRDRFGFEAESWRSDADPPSSGRFAATFPREGGRPLWSRIGPIS